MLLAGGIGPSAIRSLGSHASLDGIPSVVINCLPLTLARGRRLLRVTPLGLHLHGLCRVLIHRRRVTSMTGGVSRRMRRRIRRGRGRCCLHRRVGTVDGRLNRGRSMRTRVTRCGRRVSGLGVPRGITRGVGGRLKHLTGVPPVAPRKTMVHACVSSLLTLP